MLCPKCGFSQPDDFYCANCGVNIDKYVQKRKKKGYTLGIVIVLLGIAAIAVTWYVQTSRQTEKEQTISATGYDKRESASKQKVLTESEIQQTKRAERSSRRRVTGRPTTEEVPPSPRSATTAPSKRGINGTPPQKDKEEAKTQQEEAQLTASQWFEKGRALDDDSELEMEAYRKAIELDSKLAPAYYHLGVIYYRLADYDRASAEFVKFLQYASEEERLEYDIYLYYSDEEVEILLEEGRQASQTQEQAGEQAGEEAGEEAGLEGVADETVEGGPESGVDSGPGVQTIVRFTSHNGQILVPVVLNGFETANVLLDTGSGMTIISTELARDIGLKVARDRTVKLRTIAAEVQAVLARLDSIELGDLKRNNFPVAVSDLKLGAQRTFDGILGMDFLNRYAIHIDNRNSRILLSPSSGP
jgi:tetratricopeptide (TPR) repeat protein